MQQFMAAEDELAAYVAAVLPRLVAVGATGALLWCFADVIPVAVRDSDHVDPLRFLLAVRALGIGEPRIDVDPLAAGRVQPERSVAQPGQVQVS